MEVREQFSGFHLQMQMPFYVIGHSLSSPAAHAPDTSQVIDVVANCSMFAFLFMQSAAPDGQDVPVVPILRALLLPPGHD